VQAIGSTELGSAVHAALAAWHMSGGDLLALYSGPEAGREMLARYLTHSLALAKTVAVEVGFNMRLGATRVKGLVDRICELDGNPVLVDYKTNASLDATLIEAYSVQLRLYGLAARRGLLPGAAGPRLLLFDMRRGEAMEVAPDDAGVEARVESAAARIAAGDFSLGHEHAQRPCNICAFRPICPDARHA
jgi:RecB family exonuclease